MPLYLGSKTVSENINMGDTVIQNTFDLFDVKWSDHVINNESWMCADDFNWIDGSVFSAAWNELKSEWDLATVDSTPAQQDVIGNITINYWKSPKGYKLVEYGGDTPETNENLLQQLYDEVGIAWYYLIDTTGQIRFKLPRTKYGFVGVRSGAGNFVDESLPNITGTFQAHTGDVGVILASTSGLPPTGAFSGVQDKKAAGLSSQSGTQDRGGTLTFDASRSSSVYQDGANVQQKSTEMHLYFYLADFVRTPLESNLNTFITETKETLNEKVNVSDYSADKTNIENDINTLETTKITQTDLDNTINTQRTNCITAIPQDIKLELVNGTLTLKAGSSYYKCDGSFTKVTTSQDISTSSSLFDGVRFVSVLDSSLNLYIISGANSGDTQPSSGSKWLNTTNNIMYNSNDNGENWVELPSFSLPIAIVTVSGGKITSIDQVFNGFGYIGNTIFALPNVEGLIPIGKNTDGGNNNKKQISVMSVKTFSGAITNGIFAIDGNGILQTGNTLVYDSNKKLNYLNGTTLAYWCNCGTFSTNSTGRITSLSPKTTFQAADYYDFKQLDDSVAKLDENNMFSGVNVFENNSPVIVGRNTKDLSNADGMGLQLSAQDKNGTVWSYIDLFRRGGSNTSEAWMYSRNKSGVVCQIGTTINDNGTYATYAPTPPASDNSTQIATTAWINAFADTSSAGNIGATYVKIGKLLIQFGNLKVSSAGTTVTLPRPFSNVAYKVVTTRSAGSINPSIANVGELKTTSFPLYAGGTLSSDGTGSFYWIAIGEGA